MSYILDALNRSEQEQKSRQAPGLDAIHGPPARAARSSRKILFLLAALVAINAVLIFWFMESQVKNVPTLLEELVGEAVEEQVIAPGGHESTVTNTHTHVTSITELPTNIQEDISGISISSHIYADDPSLRMVNINGRSVHEGDIVAAGIRLVEISEEGVILSYQHYIFEMNIIRGWSLQ